MPEVVEVEPLVRMFELCFASPSREPHLVGEWLALDENAPARPYGKERASLSCVSSSGVNFDTSNSLMTHLMGSVGSGHASMARICAIGTAWNEAKF